MWASSGGGTLLSAEGTVSSKQLRVGEDGSVITVGDVGAEVMGARIVEAGRSILQPTAIGAWNETLKGIEVLRTAKSTEGFLFESVLASVTLVHLVTGMEAYAGARIWELETEGIKPNIDDLFVKVVSKRQRDAGLLEALKAEAQEQQLSVLRLIINKRIINFQNYHNLKRAFSGAYGLSLSNIGLTSPRVARLKTFIKYRHVIVHVSPMLGMLNGV